jgi:hypothetical protein
MKVVESNEIQENSEERSVNNNTVQYENDDQSSNDQTYDIRDTKVTATYPLDSEDQFSKNIVDNNLAGVQPIPENIAYAQIPLTSARVFIPKMEETLINQHLSYPISFTWNGKVSEFTRRFSDFDQLRKALEVFLPYSFIFPVHRKKLIVL